MATRDSSRIVVAAVGIAGVVVAAVATWLAARDRTAPKPDSVWFREAATEAGLNWQMGFLPGEQGETFKINLYDHGCGLAVGDFDGDGKDDVYLVNQLGNNVLYRNKGDGTFEDVTAAAGVALGDRVCVAATFADYDNDGRPDLFVTSTRGGNVLFRNTGDGKFKDVTKDAGLTHVGHSQTAVFFDYDNDGHLDLFLANTAAWTLDTLDKVAKYYPGKGGDGLGQVIHSPKETNVLYRNTGKGTFVDVTAAAGLKGLGWAGDATAFDYNGDGKMDLFVTSMFGRCQLYRNDGGTFTDVTLVVLGKTPWGGTGSRAGDFNNDGRLDLYVVDMHSDMWMGLDENHNSLELAKEGATKKYRFFGGKRAEGSPQLQEEERLLGKQVGFKHEECLFGNACYRNDGGGKFTEVSDRAGLETFWPWGIATGDFDNDGFEDAFVPAGMGYPFYYWPNSLLANQGDGTFRDRAAEVGIEPPARGTHQEKQIAGKPAARSSRAAAVADFDGDGRLDVIANNFNDRPYYFRNVAPKANYVAFRLQGTHSNRDAIGAVVRVYAGDQVMTRQIQAAGGYLAQSSKTVHVGLGGRVAVDRVEITWPGGDRQTLSGVAINQVVDVVEPGK